MSMAEPSGRRLGRLVSRRRFVIITEAGVGFARECYCSSGSRPGVEMELYGFLLRLLSFGGMMPFDVVRRWRRMGVLRRAVGREFVVVSVSVGVVPKKAVEGAVREIWGECPKSIYV